LNVLSVTENATPDVSMADPLPFPPAPFSKPPPPAPPAPPIAWLLMNVQPVTVRLVPTSAKMAPPSPSPPVPLTGGALRQVLHESAGTHVERPAIGDLHGAALHGVAGIDADRLVLAERIAGQRERPPLVHDAASILGIAAADGQARDRDGRRGRADVEDPVFPARVHVDQPGARSLDGHVLVDRQLAAGQADRLAVQSGGERDRVAGLGLGNDGAERPRSAVGGTRHGQGAEDQAAFERLQPRRSSPATPGRLADRGDTAQSGQESV
jgi:hypothetical protein